MKVLTHACILWSELLREHVIRPGRSGQPAVSRSAYVCLVLSDPGWICQFENLSVSEVQFKERSAFFPTQRLPR